MAIIGGGKTPVNGEIIASGIRRKGVVGHQRVATAEVPLGKPAQGRYPSVGQAFALIWLFGFRSCRKM
jgi:hypothetical protein